MVSMMSSFIPYLTERSLSVNQQNHITPLRFISDCILISIFPPSSHPYHYCIVRLPWHPELLVCTHCMLLAPVLFLERWVYLACTSLLHVAYYELPKLIDGLLHMITDDGVFYASFKYGNSERVKDGRFFCDMNEEHWEALKQKITAEFKDKTWLTTDRRADRNEEWFNIMIKR